MCHMTMVDENCIRSSNVKNLVVDSIRIPTLAWHICFIIPNKPQFGKVSMKTTMTASRSSENGGSFAGGHFAGGHDGMANHC